tara:strand:+ start:690 stop:1844 length:1155 start_codon:yes stop_codon:yes gene_type:complete
MSDLSYIDKLLDGVEVEWKALGEISEYSKTRISHELLNKANYIGVNNLLQNRAGKTESDHVPVAGNSTKYQNDDILIGNIRPYLKKIWLANNTGGTNGDVLVIRLTNNTVNPRFLFQVLADDKFFNYNMQHAKGAKMPRGDKTKIMDYCIPIPPLKIQNKIVQILDKFAELTAELAAELEMRRKQYSHYQFEVLQFTETTQHLKIGECCDIKKGLTPIKKAIPGKYPLVATTEERQSSSEYHFDCAAVCVPLISSRGHGVASIDRIYFQEGKFALGNILCAIIPNDSRFLSAKFLRYYLFYKKDVLLVPLMRGGANVSLTMDSLKKVKIPIPPIADQQRIVRILDKFDELVKGLPREIELRQQQYEYYRDLLLSFPKREVVAHD